MENVKQLHRTLRIKNVKVKMQLISTLLPDDARVKKTIFGPPTFITPCVIEMSVLLPEERESIIKMVTRAAELIGLSAVSADLE